ncbi:hypothetical protein [Streptomyces luteolus]|uniref:Molecular chaperone DnaJ n=1 Tax=Streptomyces luteolus TaxID=3043615 RepID=A0ABT6ST73_9ACTN|nr:hypothetical protein [Streptomyces sp. B-S-A12]MDI3418565.1 hypothetical protein [Streptomyces sp. B-S-A12]
MATRKSPARKPVPAPCKPCHGTGEVPVKVRVGRSHRVVGEQTGMCLKCFGTGHAPTD